MAKKFQSDKPTMAEILDLKKPLETEVSILIDPDYQRRLQELEDRKIEAARASRSKTADISQPGPDRVQAEIDALMEEASDYVVTFKFRDIGRKKLNDLAQNHPPTKEQQEEYKKLGAPGVLEFNVDTFGPVLVAATCYEPEMTVEQATRIFDDWGAGEIDALFATAMAACRGRANFPLSKRSTAKTRTSA